MKVKIDFELFFINLIVLLNICFFNIIKVPDIVYAINGYHKKHIILFIVFILLFSLVMKKNKIKKMIFLVPVIFFVFSIILISIFSVIFLDETVMSVFRTTYFYYIILFYFYISDYIKKDEKNLKKVIDSVIFTGTTFSFIIIIHTMLSQLSGIELLHYNSLGMYHSDYVGVGGIIRIARPADFIGLTTCFNLIAIFYNTYSDKRKGLLINYLIINIVFMVLISQTRMYIIAIVFAAIILIILKIFQYNKILVVNVITMFSIFFLLNYTKIYNFILTFFEGDRLISTQIRINEYIFYFNQIFSNGFFGRGFIAATTAEKSYLLHGPSMHYTVTDLGIYGFFAIFGLLGMIFVLITIFKLAKIIRNSSGENKVVLIFMCSYIFFTSITLSLTDPQRIVLLPISLAILEGIYFKKQNNKRKE